MTEVCATCRVRLVPVNRSVCCQCYPPGEENLGIAWWQGVAEAKQQERDAARAALAEVVAALRDLLNVQTGPPLNRRGIQWHAADRWRAAIQQAEAVLKQHEGKL